jgi:hypothetical protein
VSQESQSQFFLHGDIVVFGNIANIAKIVMQIFKEPAWHARQLTTKEADAVFPIRQTWRMQKRKHYLLERPIID